MPPVDEKSYGANKPRIKGKINDLGIFFNSIDNIVRMGKDVGMTVEKSEKEYDDRVEITLCVKKKYQQA